VSILLPDRVEKDRGLFYFVWVIPGAIFVLVTALNYFKFLLHLPSKTRYLFIAAGGIYIGGALAMEMVGGYYADLAGQRNLIYGTIATTEEIFEMVGVLIFIYALLAYIGSYIQDIDVRFKVLDDSRELFFKNSLKPWGCKEILPSSKLWVTRRAIANMISVKSRSISSRSFVDSK
jgi:hypothetical protein